MAVTPDEGGPLQREALIVLARGADVVDLEAQALELGRLPGHESGLGALAVRGPEDLLRVVVAPTEGEAPVEEALEVRVAAVAPESSGADDVPAGDWIRADHDVVELLGVPEPLDPDDGPLVEAARSRLVPERDVQAVQLPIRVRRDREPARAELEVQAVREVEVRLRSHDVAELAERALTPGHRAEGAGIVEPRRADGVVGAERDLDELVGRREPGGLDALRDRLTADHVLDRG